MQYNMNFDIAAIFVCLFSIYCVIAKKGLVRQQNRVLLTLCIMTLSCAAFDILAVFSLQPDSRIPFALCYIFNLIYFLIHNAVALVCLVYLGHLTGENYKYSPFYYFGISFPYLLLLIGLLTNHYHHFLFTVTPERLYIRETGFFLLYLVASIYIIAIIVKLFRFRISMDPSRRWMILIYLVSSVVALTVEYFIPSALVELFFQSISILGVIFTIDNLRELTDDNTNAYNQMALEEDLHLLINAHQDFHVFVINLPHIMDSIPVLGAAPIFKILMDVSSFLRSFPGVTVYHCGGGHFAMIYMDGSHREEMLEAITARFREPWIYENIQLNLNMELCYAESPEEIRSLKDFFLIMQAPVRNTTAVPNNINVYDYQRYLRERQVLEALHKALHTHGFEIYYQPIMDVANHAIHSAEALIRLNDDVLGYISPEEFISIAERHGLIIEIGDYVMEEVCRFICENDISDYGIQYIDINLSPIQCMDQKLAARFLGIMKKYHVATNQINFELTEAAINRNHELLSLMIERFSKRGVYITLDDYGTGNSNISTIFQLPFLMVKLDKNILWNAEKSKRSLEILKHTMSLVKNMGMKLLIEGIETEHQLNWLLENGVDYCQGYYFSRAIPGGDFLRFIEHFNHMEE